MLLASIPRGPGDHRCHATPIFKWGSLVRLISWPAQLTRAQQGRLQRRSPFLELHRHCSQLAHPCETQHHNAFNRPTRNHRGCHIRRASTSIKLDSRGKSLQTESFSKPSFDARTYGRPDRVGTGGSLMCEAVIEGDFPGYDG